MVCIVLSNLNILFLFIRSARVRAVPRNWLVMNMVVACLFGGWLYIPALGGVIMRRGSCLPIITIVCLISFNVCNMTLLGTTIYQGKQIISPIKYWCFQRKRVIQLYIVASWIMALLIATPVFIAYDLSDNVEIMDEGFGNVSVKHNCITRSDHVTQYNDLYVVGDSDTINGDHYRNTHCYIQNCEKAYQKHQRAVQSSHCVRNACGSHSC